VSQLAVDVVLATLHAHGLLERVGTMESAHLLPFTGQDSFASTAPPFDCSPVEVYGIVGKPVYVVHQRSICSRGRRLAHCREFIALLASLCPGGMVHLVVPVGSGTEEIEAMRAGRVFVATVATPPASSPSAHADAAASLAQQLAKCTLAPLASALSDVLAAVGAADVTAALGAVSDERVMLARRADRLNYADDPLQENDYEGFLSLSHASSDPTAAAAVPVAAGLPPLRDRFIGLGMARTLFTRVKEGDFVDELSSKSSSSGSGSSSSGGGGAGVAITLLGRYCMEGDNRADGRALAALVLKALGVLSPGGSGHCRLGEEPELRVPTSWNALFGAPMAAETQANMFF
jgi:hypothetical protein